MASGVHGKSTQYWVDVFLCLFSCGCAFILDFIWMNWKSPVLHRSIYGMISSPFEKSAFSNSFSDPGKEELFSKEEFFGKFSHRYNIGHFKTFSLEYSRSVLCWMTPFPPWALSNMSNYSIKSQRFISNNLFIVFFRNHNLRPIKWWF